MPQLDPSLVFCWLYRVSPSLAAKNTINLILLLAIWWCSCVEPPLLLLGESVCYDQCVLLAKLYQLFPCFILYFKVKFAYYPRCSLLPTFEFQSLIMNRMLVLKYLVGLHKMIQLLQRYLSKHRLRLPWYWMVCLGKQQRSFCRFWDCIQVLHFRLFCWLWWLLHFFWGIPAHSSRYNGHLS